MSEYDAEYVGDLVKTVIEWCMSDAPDWFDDSFVHSLYMQHDEGRKLSVRQVEALENISKKFQIG